MARSCCSRRGAPRRAHYNRAAARNRQIGSATSQMRDEASHAGRWSPYGNPSIDRGFRAGNATGGMHVRNAAAIAWIESCRGKPIPAAQGTTTARGGTTRQVAGAPVGIGKSTTGPARPRPSECVRRWCSRELTAQLHD